MTSQRGCGKEHRPSFWLGDIEKVALKKTHETYSENMEFGEKWTGNNITRIFTRTYCADIISRYQLRSITAGDCCRWIRRPGRTGLALGAGSFLTAGMIAAGCSATGLAGPISASKSTAGRGCSPHRWLVLCRCMIFSKYEKHTRCNFSNRCCMCTFLLSACSA